ncbi:MAG: hypothetical protein IT230_10445 [Flavobacteriales bacterium]|nr:hypothetical protein [Flavobacteriales bacterium]
MRATAVVLGFCLQVLAGPAGAQPIADARTAPLGSQVTVSGRVTSGPSLGSIRYLQDAGAGIAAYPGSGSVPGFSPQPGDDITITGTLTSFNGLLEITPITAHTVNSNGNAIPAAVAVAANGLVESVESQLVRMEGVYFSGSGTFSPGNWIVQDGTGNATVYLRNGHPLVGTPVPSGPVDITGLVSQYDTDAPYTSGYQLLPRGTTDITPHTGILIVPPVVWANPGTSSFNLMWGTNLPGSTEAYYGTTPALGMYATAGTATTSHILPFSGLQPATFYYVQPFSVADGDTAFAELAIHSTVSTSSQSIQVYFTKDVDTNMGNGTDALGLFQATDDTIKAYIDRAQSTLDIAIYNTNSTVVVAAVNAARDRGVQVRWIAEGNTANTALNDLDPAIPVLFRTNSEGSGMHNKFMVIDAEDDQRAVVMSGSCNWTTQSFFDDYNNLVFIQDQALARCYRMEFEEMWGGTGAQPVPANSRFGAEKTDNTPHLFFIGGSFVESFFSPTDGMQERTIQLLDHAQHSVLLALYVFTDNDLGDAVLNAHERPFMLVQGDVEDIGSTGSEFDYLTGQGIELYSHYNEPGLLHHKYAILDEAAGTDPLVITGSHNWTASASSVNDENTLIIHSAEVANQFYQEWAARHQAVLAVEESGGHPAPEAWPVPADQVLHVCPAGSGTARIMLRDAAGRAVFRQRAQGIQDIPVSQLPAGLYLLEVEQAGSRARRMVSVCH